VRSQVGDRARGGTGVVGERRREGVQVDAGVTEARLSLRAAMSEPRSGERRVISSADEVKGVAHERCLDDPPLLEGVRELVLVEALQARPQTDVRGR
jgi:hypothetical protein